jgi:hypothetical protein
MLSVVSRRRPSHAPASAAIVHQASEKIRSVRSPRDAATATVTAPSAVASPAARNTVALRKSV